ncbi:MAG: hypothetical protein KKI08_16275 [Armatimonadetes bacterium]|nr:hypothetical protein [Armatimonadota bacterium]
METVGYCAITFALTFVLTMAGTGYIMWTYLSTHEYVKLSDHNQFVKTLHDRCNTSLRTVGDARDRANGLAEEVEDLTRRQTALARQHDEIKAQSEHLDHWLDLLRAATDLSARLRPVVDHCLGAMEGRGGGRRQERAIRQFRAQLVRLDSALESPSPVLPDISQLLLDLGASVTAIASGAGADTAGGDALPTGARGKGTSASGGKLARE